MASPTIILRLDQETKTAAEKQAKKLGFKKTDGTANVSQYIRSLIEKDLKK